MQCVNRLCLFSQWLRVEHRLLSACWLLGVLLGFSAALQAGENVAVLMCRISFGSVSIVDLLLSCLFPFLIAAIAAYLSEPWLLLIVCLLKAFLFSFCAFGISLAYGSAGWLVRILLLFSDLILLPILYFYCYFLLKKGFGRAKVLSYIVCAAVLVVGFVNKYFIVPFCGSVLSL